MNFFPLATTTTTVVTTSHPCAFVNTSILPTWPTVCENGETHILSECYNYVCVAGRWDEVSFCNKQCEDDEKIVSHSDGSCCECVPIGEHSLDFFNQVVDPESILYFLSRSSSDAEMGCVSTRMGDRFSALLVSLMALQLTLVDQNSFRPCLKKFML